MSLWEVPPLKERNMSRDLSPGVTWHGMGQSWVRLDLLEGIKANPAPGINIHSSSTMVSSNLGSHVVTSDLSHRDGNNDPNHDLTELIFFLVLFLNTVRASQTLHFKALFTGVFQAQHLLPMVSTALHMDCHFRAEKRSI